jgi:predicted Zn-dependent peptidase
MDRLRQRLYELEDDDSKYREFWVEYNWYRRYGGLARHTDPVPATTGNEHMDISLDLPKENIELFFRLEADRMVNAVLRGWEAQRFTVLEQILNIQTRPERGRFYQAIDGATGLAHPVYQSAGGHFRDFAYFNRAAMLRMYDAYFVPGNATLVLVGDITLGEARSLAERYFGRIPKGSEAPARMDMEAEPVPGGAVRLDWMEPLDPRVVLRFRIPGVGHPDRPVFDVIAAILSGKNGLLRVVLDQGIAGSQVRGVEFHVSARRLGSPSTLSLVAMARRDEDLPVLERTMLEVVDRLREGKVKPENLGRARKALRLEWQKIRSDRGNLASELGRFQVRDSWKTLEPYMEARERATVEDIQRVAQQYFVASNRILATSRRNPVGKGF